ncbi:hypothetical protein GCM10009786_09810 [Leucobacter alluvii]|uniref:Bacitracin resistance protein n=1 Tax=Leucobacter alluvii TaxID=340321 RepID=A0ABN3B498_9MICO
MAKLISAWSAGVLLGLLYLYAIVAGIGNLVGVMGMSAALDTGLTGSGRFWLVVGVVMPAVVFALALLLGRRRGAGARILLLAAGVALVAAWQIDIMHVVPDSSYFA